MRLFKISDVSVKEILECCAITHFQGLCLLKDRSYILDVVYPFFKDMKGRSVSPGQFALLMDLGTKISNMTVEKFVEISFKKNQSRPEEEEIKELTKYPLLNLLVHQAGKHNIHETVKKVSVYVKVKGGRDLYEFLHANLPLLSPSQVDKELQSCGYSKEGNFDVSIFCNSKLL